VARDFEVRVFASFAPGLDGEEVDVEGHDRILPDAGA
jgi:hypothetical protein